MSGNRAPTVDASTAVTPARERHAQRYASIVVVGGGCYGSYYVRQLGRAVAAGALACDRVLVVDRDADCAVGCAARRTAQSAGGARKGEGAVTADAAAADAARWEAHLGAQPAGVAGAPPEHHDATELTRALDQIRSASVEFSLVRASWAEFFAHFLAAETAGADAVVPSPLMPHLLYEWLLERARARWPQRAIGSAPLARPPSTPWERAAPDGTHYVSFAEWVCPINCVEPPLCPEIRGPRTWSLPPAMRAYVAAERARQRDILGPVLLHCTHRVYGVGMIDVRDVQAADAFVAEAGARGPARILVGTVSHCHGALNLLSVGDVAG